LLDGILPVPTFVGSSQNAGHYPLTKTILLEEYFEKVQALKPLSRFGLGLGAFGGWLSVFGLFRRIGVAVLRC